MSKTCRVLIACCFSLVCGSASSASDPRVQLMGDNFVAALPADWRLEPGTWSYLDIIDCFTNGSTCYGSNPSSPYGYPDFGGAMSTKLDPSDAVVVFMRTPPEVRYFGFTQYLYDRAISSKPFVFASLSDTLNHLKFSTLQAARPGTAPFDQYAVLVWAADMNTLASVQVLLAQQGIPESKVNFIPLPVGLPLFMGDGEMADTFTLLMRMALPTVPADFSMYMADKPFYVVKVRPANPPLVAPAPIIGYASETTGVSEDTALAAALDTLVANIKANHASSFTFKDQLVAYSKRLGWECLADDVDCIGGDNHDALYSQDLSRDLTVGNLKDIVIIAGVNHQKTGKAVYTNHSVVDPVKTTGIVSIEDPQMTSRSALYHAGVKQPNDPRVKQFSKLYAYAVSYDCNGLKYCINIPAPTADNPVGLPPGAAFTLWGRSYVEPRTGVRPALNEVVRHQVMVGKRR
ncbi:MAG: hypothetical protein IV093_07025 [Rubrivivax sp.]|nr:hypothetical protein [Rubrivivax sp.]